MDPVSVIVAALAAGASTGLGETVSQAIKDAYGALKSLVGRRLKDRPDADLVLERYEKAPDTWREPLMSELGAAGVVDPDLVALAEQLLELVKAENPAALGKYNVDIGSGQGIQVGDHGAQHNVFSAPPGPP